MRPPRRRASNENALYRWRTRNQHFMAAMNAWRRDHLEHARDQFLLMRDSAMEAVRLGLAKGDAHTTTTSASISIWASASISLGTCTMVVAGRISPKISP